MSEAALSVDRVEAGYGAAAVLKGVSLDVGGGEFVALLGSSGCGKTTLLRAISGFVPVRQGAIRLGGRDITHAPPDKRGMAMVFQSYALWPHMNAAQNIGYGLKLRGLAKADIATRVERALAMLKLEGFGGRNVTQLSGGQRQRVALGRALAIEPEILLLDEPLSNLDARIREEVRHEIKSLQRALGITAIHVTHDREEAMVMADRIVILDAGRIAQVGPPEEVYNRPASPFVAAFMGATNVMPLTLRRDGVKIVVESGPHNEAAALPGETAERGGRQFAGPSMLHFRSEAATLTANDAPAAGAALVLRGKIAQRSYPGGFWRYAVRVGEREFMVDDRRRFEVGAAMGVALPAEALHLFPSGDERRDAA